MSEGNLFLIVSTAFVIGLSGALMPGPMLAICISESARRGFWAGPGLVLGHAIVEGLLVVALVFGIGRFLERDLVGAIIGVVGGVVLVLLGVALVRAARRERLSAILRSGRKPGRGGVVVSGVAVTVANPLWVMWWVTIGAAYVLASLKSGTVGVASFFGGHIFSDLLWYSVVALIITTGRRFITDRVYMGLLMLCGLFITGVGVYFAVDGVQALI